jgi:transposase
MPQNKVLDTSEIAVILQLNDVGLQQKEIANRLKRSRSLISRFLSDPDNYGKRQKQRKRRKIDERGLRALVREAEKGEMGTKAIVQSLNLGITRRHACRLLKKEGGLRFYKLKRKFALTSKHKMNRINFSKTNKDKISDIDRTIWTDYAKFTLQGLQRLRRGCWRKPGAPLRPAHTVITRGLSGRAGHMVWAGISLLGKTEIAFVKGKQTAADHIETLESHLLPFIDGVEELAPDIQCRLMQDGASIHTAGLTQRWLAKQTFDVLEWPARSPDLNPIENAWSQLARIVYDDGRKQYDSLGALKKAIQRAWFELDMGYIERLIKSMPKRFEKCIRAKGEKINY